MKTIIINASPRKSMNTAQLLKEAQKCAESVGAETACRGDPMWSPESQ